MGFVVSTTLVEIIDSSLEAVEQKMTVPEDDATLSSLKRSVASSIAELAVRKEHNRGSRPFSQPRHRGVLCESPFDKSAVRLRGCQLFELC